MRALRQRWMHALLTPTLAAMTVVLGAMALTSCVPLYPLDSAPCPCGFGYECCGDENVCVPTGQCMVCPPPAAMPPKWLAKTICNCNEWLSMCVGATWTYLQITRQPDGDAGAGEDAGVHCSEDPGKAVAIVDYRDPGEPLYSKSGFEAFNLCRASSDRVKHSWLTTDVDHSDFWQFDDWFLEQRRWDHSIYYDPYKVRLDETKEATGTTWHESFTQYEVVKDQLEPTVTPIFATWTVVHWSEARGPCGMPPIPPRFQVGPILCHRRWLSNGEENDFCFAKGIGKIYEYSYDREDDEEKAELLLAYRLPGCN